MYEGKRKNTLSPQCYFTKLHNSNIWTVNWITSMEWCGDGEGGGGRLRDIYIAVTEAKSQGRFFINRFKFSLYISPLRQNHGQLMDGDDRDGSSISPGVCHPCHPMKYA